MTHALIYTRVSQDRAGGRSVSEQETEARQVCDREGWTVVEVVTDSVGASRHSKGTRTGWARAQRLLAAGNVDVLVTWEASRAQRDLAAYAELRNLCAAHKVKWSYSGRTHDLTNSDDRFSTGLDALMAEREADATAERVQRAMRANAARGRPHGRRLFGYQRIYDPGTGALVGQEPHPSEAEVVRGMFADYLSGVGIRTIARRLFEQGVTTGSGARWQDSQVRRALQNPAYAARRVHLGEVVGDGDWPALVEAATFDKVNARLAAMGERSTRQTKTARLLTGVGRCGVCGAKVHALPETRNGKRRRKYECREKFCVARDLTMLDAHVVVRVLERLARPDVAAALGDAAPPPKVVDALATVKELKDRLDDAVAQFTAGKLSGAVLGKVEADLQPRIAAAEKAARNATIPLEVDVPATNVDAWWDGLSAEQKREVVGALIASVTILPAKKGSKVFDPKAVKIEWRRS